MSDSIYRHEAIRTITSYNGTVDKSVAKRLLLQMPSAQPERAIKDCRNCKHGNYNDHWDTYFCYYSGDCNDWDKWEPSAESVKAYTKSDYIMALHKEYGCTLTMAEEAHNKALEYLRSKARMKG